MSILTEKRNSHIKIQNEELGSNDNGNSKIYPKADFKYQTFATKKEFTFFNELPRRK